MKHDDLTVERTVGMRLGALAVLAGACVALAGCGGGSKSPAVASVAATTTPSTSARTTSPGRDAPKSGSNKPGADSANPALAFSRCMRAHGVPNFPDPSPSGGFVFHPGAGFNLSSPAVKAAQAECQKLVGGGPAPGATHPSAAWLAQMVKAARCMRRHGISHFPDPMTTVPSPSALKDGGVISDIEGAVFVFPTATIDPQSPAFVRAAKACAFPLHNH
jgi:hypothetical protein